MRATQIHLRIKQREGHYTHLRFYGRGMKRVYQQMWSFLPIEVEMQTTNGWTKAKYNPSFVAREETQT